MNNYAINSDLLLAVYHTIPTFINALRKQSFENIVGKRRKYW